MSLLSKIFRAVPREEMSGIHLDTTRPFWEVSGETNFPSLLLALPDLLPVDCVLYFEGGSPSCGLLEFLQDHAIPERAHVAYGTIWPKPRVFHLAATPEIISRLAALTRSCAFPELAIHFHIYRDQRVLVQWYDAFSDPSLVSAELAEKKVRTFAARLGMSLKRGSVEPSAPRNGGPATPVGNSGVTEEPPSVN